MRISLDLIFLILVLLVILISTMFIVPTIFSTFKHQRIADQTCDSVGMSAPSFSYIDEHHINCYAGNKVVLEDGVYVNKPIIVGIER